MSATVRIAGNEIRNFSGSGILAISVTGATIEDNTILPGAFANQIPIGGCAGVTGVGAANGLSFVGTADSLVQRNTVHLVPALDGDGATPCTTGIIVVGDNGAATADSTDNVFRMNGITGQGTYAVLVGTDTSMAETGNQFISNSVGSFIPSAATVFLGTGATGNTFIGYFPSIEGNQAGNSFP